MGQEQLRRSGSDRDVRGRKGTLAGKSTGRDGTAGTTYRLRILATSDVHAHLMDYDYTWDQPLKTAGLVRTASLIRRARSTAANVLLFDNGDFLQGSALGEVAATVALDGAGGHPVVAAMNRLAYDAVALGNHDFSYGIDFLDRALAGARFPVLCANAVRSLGKEPLDDLAYRPATTILERTLAAPDGRTEALRIGVIGLLPPQITQWERKHLAGRIQTRDCVEAARAWVPALRAGGADIVIALCHSGIGPETHISGMENAAVPLAALPGVDVVIAGHVHLPFPGPDVVPTGRIDSRRGSVCGKPAVMAGFWGSHLGQIDLDLTLGTTGWTIARHRAASRPIAVRDGRGAIRSLAGRDADLAAAIAPAHRATLAQVRQPVGRSDVALHSYFARLCDCAALQLVHEAQLGWLADWAQGTDYESLPRLSAASPFKSGGRGGPQYFTDIPPGDLALRHVHDLYTFPNSVRAVVVNGATLRAWLERSAAQFLRLVPGAADQPLFDPDAPAYNFDSLSGVSYAIDLSQPSRYTALGNVADLGARRITALSHRGRPVTADMRFLVATNNFRAAGGGQFPGLSPCATVAEPLTLTSDVIRAHIARAGHVAPQVRHGWRLAPLPPGTSAWFDTGPRAADHLGEDTGLTIEPVGETPEGFLRCRVRF